MNKAVLIIKFGALGDVIMATGLIRCIQAQHKNAAVFLLTSEEYAALFQHWPGLCVKTSKRRGLAPMLSLLRWIRRQGFQRLYDLQSNDRSTVLCALSAVPERVGNHPRFPYHLHPGEKYSGQTHIYERMLAVLESAGLDTGGVKPGLITTENEKRNVSDWLEQHGLTDKPIALLHAGASPKHPEKCWPYYAPLAARLVNAGYRVIWLGSHGEKRLNQRLSKRHGIDATGLFSLAELCELGRHARFALCNDSGPMHLLACSNIPVFAFFGRTNWRRNHAVGQQDNVIAADKNQPAFIETPLADLPLQQVLDQLTQKELLH